MVHRHLQQTARRSDHQHHRPERSLALRQRQAVGLAGAPRGLVVPAVAERAAGPAGTRAAAHLGVDPRAAVGAAEEGRIAAARPVVVRAAVVRPEVVGMRQAPVVQGVAPRVPAGQAGAPQAAVPPGSRGVLAARRSGDRPQGKRRSAHQWVPRTPADGQTPLAVARVLALVVRAEPVERQADSSAPAVVAVSQAEERSGCGAASLAARAAGTLPGPLDTRAQGGARCTDSAEPACRLAASSRESSG